MADGARRTESRRRALLRPVLLLLSAALIAAALWSDRSGSDPGATTVPQVVRLAEPQALARLGRAGFTVNVHRRPEDGARSGLVFAQEPPGGVESPSGAVVTIHVSSGAATTVVPAVTGLRVAAAEAVVGRAGRTARRVLVYSGEPRGVVVGQSPTAGARALPGQPVQLGVSRGTTTRVTVPSVVGRRTRSAGRVLRRAALGEPAPRTVPAAAGAGIVVWQSPVAGSRAAEGAPVRLGISDGSGSTAAAAPDNPHMPIVVGFAETEAVRELESFGYRIRIAYRPVDGAGSDGVVVRQNPAGGGPRGSVVTLVVGAADLR